ncbi:MAG: hypothetical protein ACOCWY_01775 [Thermodesulfobacteriota bacterium]
MSADNESDITEQVDSRLNDLFGEDDAPSKPKHTHQVDDSEDSMDDNTTNTELDNRLDTFFEKGKRTNSDTGGSGIDPKDLENSPIKDLKSVILSLEWEITDQVMQKLGEEIQRLEKQSKKDKIAVAFLQLLGSLGKYIRKKRAEAHPDSIRLLHSVYEQLELVMLSRNLSDAEKKKMLVAQVNNYKTLKEEILVAKEAPAEPAETPKPSAKKTPQPRETMETAPETASEGGESETRLSVDTGALATGDVSAVGREILSAMEEMRKTIQSEFSELRAELKRWRETR